MDWNLNDICSLTGFSKKQITTWVKAGLIPPSTITKNLGRVGGLQVFYPEEAVNRLVSIKNFPVLSLTKQKEAGLESLALLLFLFGFYDENIRYNLNIFVENAASKMLTWPDSQKQTIQSLLSDSFISRILPTIEPQQKHSILNIIKRKHFNSIFLVTNESCKLLLARLFLAYDESNLIELYNKCRCEMIANIYENADKYVTEKEIPLVNVHLSYFENNVIPIFMKIIPIAYVPDFFMNLSSNEQDHIRYFIYMTFYYLGYTLEDAKRMQCLSEFTILGICAYNIFYDLLKNNPQMYNSIQLQITKTINDSNNWIEEEKQKYIKISHNKK